MNAADDEAWLAFWYAPWQSAEPGWLVDDWGRAFLAGLAQDALAPRLAYPAWCARHGWPRPLPAEADPLWRGYCLAAEATLTAALRLIGAAALAGGQASLRGAGLPPEWTPAEREAWRWGRRYRLARPLDCDPAGWPAIPALLGLGLLRQAMGGEAGPHWPRLALRIAPRQVQALPAGSPAPRLDQAGLRRLCRAALAQARAEATDAGMSDGDAAVTEAAGHLPAEPVAASEPAAHVQSEPAVTA
ncbi:hypothetical protein [Chitinimonas koreensis]|uniref:hypothetical protein n=1 Tax=Chitinimonas koreensis TaxID=356302 RepID=UPI0004252192|nr:hypothetical protein [Chitinimonas koreensis]QNM97620.1 hypothetical protein H9L41_04790 [Chitinimonas koreensis]